MSISQKPGGGFGPVVERADRDFASNGGVEADATALAACRRDLGVIPAYEWIDSCCPGAIPWSRSS